MAVADPLIRRPRNRTFSAKWRRRLDRHLGHRWASAAVSRGTFGASFTCPASRLCGRIRLPQPHPGPGAVFGYELGAG
jgi:hypothetical protein